MTEAISDNYWENVKVFVITINTGGKAINIVFLSHGTTFP